MEEKRFCPKCKDEMKFVKPYHAIPQLPAQAIMNGSGPAISFNAAFPLEIWCCETCRFVEFYAAGRRSAKE